MTNTLKNKPRAGGFVLGCVGVAHTSTANTIDTTFGGYVVKHIPIQVCSFHLDLSLFETQS